MNSLYRHFRIAYCFIIPIVRMLFPLRIHHAERLPDGPMVVCAPHSALVDPILIMAVLTIRRYPRYLAKKELFSIPVVGAFLRWIGMIPVDRGNADISSIKAALKVLKEKGIIGIFPEGTRVREEHASEAKTGAVMLPARGSRCCRCGCPGKSACSIRWTWWWAKPTPCRCCGAAGNISPTRRS